MTNDELQDLVTRGVAWFDSLTPRQQAEHRQLQAESFARGMGPCEHGVLDFEQCADRLTKVRVYRAAFTEVMAILRCEVGTNTAKRLTEEILSKLKGKAL